MDQNSCLYRILKAPIKLFQSPHYYYCRLKYNVLAPVYQSIILPVKVLKVRKKSVVDVLFVLNELGAWKTESLYRTMSSHSRFNPKLLIVPAKETPEAISTLTQYLNNKGYKYDEIQNEDSDYKKYFRTDIIFYQKPYDDVMDYKYSYLNHLNVLFCYVLYGFRNRNYPQIKQIRFIRFIWQFYAENTKVIEESVPVFSTKAKNMVNTGLPFMDDLLLDKVHFDDPWKNLGDKKRIIYAPHHTIYSDLYEYATFLDYSDFMLEMAKKYHEQVQWAFKPHPVLKEKLFEVWGEEKTNKYYAEWEMLDNTQIADGEYMGLFKYSDAMIHDCGSFRVEYLYTGKPVMFLKKKEPENDYMNWQTIKALELHYSGFNECDIENFIQNVIKGVDPLRDDRKRFVDDNLTPPYGKTASQNIINAILGEEEYAVN